MPVGGGALGSVDERVAWDRDAVGRLPVGGDVQQDRAVGAARAALAVDRAAVAVTAVGAEDQDVERLLGAFVRVVRLLDEVVDVAAGAEVAVEMAVERPGADPGADGQEQHGDHDGEHDRTRA